MVLICERRPLIKLEAEAPMNVYISRNLCSRQGLILMLKFSMFAKSLVKILVKAQEIHGLYVSLFLKLHISCCQNFRKQIRMLAL